MKKGAIWYKTLWAWPGSDLNKLLTEAAATKDPEKKRELQEKAKRCYDDTIERYNKLMKG